MNARIALVLTLLFVAPAFAQEEAVGLKAPTGEVSHAAPSSFLTNILRQFKDAFARTSGNAARGGTMLAMALMSWVIAKAAAKMGLRAAVSQNVFEVATAVVYAVLSFHAPAIAAGFAEGLSAAVSGDDINGGILSNPSLLITKAFEVTKNVFTQGMQDTSQTSGFVDTVKAIGANALTGFERAPIFLAGIFVVIGYWWTALVGMKAVIYAHAKILVGTTLCPWLILPISRPIGMAGVSVIVSASVELAVQSAVVGIGFTVLQSMHLDANSDFQAVLETGLGCCAVALVCSGLSSFVSFAISTARVIG